MIHINKNHSLLKMKEFVHDNLNHPLDYMPNSFNIQQQEALELFKKRIFLEEVIEETIAFNRKLTWEQPNEYLHLTTTAEELIDVFQLRSFVFKDIHYENEFPDVIESLNFDVFDKSSAIVYYKRDKEITASCRLIFDSQHQLPSEEKVNFNSYRKNKKVIGEISRNIVKYRDKGLNLEFKYSMASMHNIFIHNNIDLTLSGIKKEHFRLFEKFGGIEVERELTQYGSLNVPCLIISWDPSQASRFFKKAFLK